MHQTISQLVGQYEDGKLTRRELVAGLALLAVGGQTSAASLKPVEVGHISLQVRDLDRSRDFYNKVLGLVVRRQGGAENTVSLGVENHGFLTLRNGNPAPLVDHFAIRLQGFSKPAVTAALKQQGVTPIDDGNVGAGFHVLDPDGFRVQLVTAAE